LSKLLESGRFQHLELNLFPAQYRRKLTKSSGQVGYSNQVLLHAVRDVHEVVKIDWVNLWLPNAERDLYRVADSNESLHGKTAALTLRNKPVSARRSGAAQSFTREEPQATFLTTTQQQ